MKEINTTEPHQDKKAALRFFKKAVRQHGLPDKVMIDKSGANPAAIKEETGQEIEIRQIKYLNNLIFSNRFI